MEELDDETEWDNENFEPPEIEAERKGELARLLKGSPLNRIRLMAT